MGPARGAVFLDRDGVLNGQVCHPGRDEYDSPLDPGSLEVHRGAALPLAQLRDAGYLLVVVTNQPAWAKGKTTRAKLEAVREKFLEEFRALGVEFDRYCCCYHHPTESVVEGLRVECDCRKPAPGMLREAAESLGINLTESWIIGDRDTDVRAGQAVGCRTILVESVEQGYRGQSDPDFRCRDVAEACSIILKGCPA